MLLSGHAGCGKTSMAKLIATVMGTDIISSTPETLKDQKALITLFDSLNYDGYNEVGDRISTIKPTVVFIDECHRLPIFAQERLGIAMEDFSISTGKANKLIWLPYFTVIGATTLSGNLSKPFYDRFKLKFFFEAYTAEESEEIVAYHAGRLGAIITNKAIKEIAARGRGIPRVMVSYVERCIDMMQSIDSRIITSALCNKTFELMGIDDQGFNKVEIKILKTLYDHDKPLSLENLSLVTGESKKSIQNDIEVYLIRNGYLIRSGKGRLITPEGRLFLERKGYAGGGKSGRLIIPSSYVRK